MRILVIALIFSSFFACKMDNIKQKSLVGTYKVSVDLASDKKDEINKSLNGAKEDIEKAKADIQKDIEDEDLRQGISSIVDGVAKIATGAASLGIGLADSIVKLVGVEVTLNEDGTIAYNSSTNIDFSSKGVKWGVENGKFCIYDKDGKIQQEFDLEAKSSKEFHLVNKDVTLVLKKLK